MPSYIGFSTANALRLPTTNDNPGVDGGVGGILQPVYIGKKYRLVDQQLVIRDLLNALNIQQGTKVGQPGYGTTLWSFVFEPNTLDVQQQLESEIRRVAAQDPRIDLNSVKAFPQENGILLEVEMAIAPFNNALQLSVFFDANTSRAILQ
jgi:phage baseplate assembly protein W|tara:strand:+ start:316 stop:765 length:450 start_codon:yes stop_codon:yes gene_type:complete